MVLNGHCHVQNRQYAISIKVIPAPTLENPKEVAYGTITCEYVINGGNCTGKDCSILKQNGIKR